MNKGLLSFCLLLAVFKASGQVCVHSDLSKRLLFKTEIRSVKRTERARRSSPGYADSCIVKITTLSKATHKPTATITYFTNFLYPGAFSQCTATRSYTTGTRRDAAVEDFDYGDFIVADFNFDGKEDFAARVDDGNSGPSYNYYLQNSAGSFILSKFLTEQMGHFPTRLSNATKTLIWDTDNGRWYFKISYRLNSKTGKWRKIQHEPVYIAKVPIQYDAD